LTLGPRRPADKALQTTSAQDIMKTELLHSIAPTALSFIVLLCAILLPGPVRAQAVLADDPVAFCRADQLALDTSLQPVTAEGSATGLLIVQNKADHPCSMRPFPTIVFADLDQRPLDIAVAQGLSGFQGGPMIDGRRRPMGHGPVVPPVTLAPHARASASMRWNSSISAGHDRCRSVSAVFLKVPEQTELAPLDTKICSASDGALEVHVGPLVLIADPH
jgi:hypothetical protein